jgi:hydroxymethylglutaryl-CoA reductase
MGHRAADQNHPGRNPDSRIPRFYQLSVDERLQRIAERCATVDPKAYGKAGLQLHDADAMVENVIGTFSLPNAVAVNMMINGVDRLIPMVIEEPSVVAAVSNTARVTREHGGFEASADDPVMIGQIQLIDVLDPRACMSRLEQGVPRLMAAARAVHPRLEQRGGGCRGFEWRTVAYDEEGEPRENMVVVHVLVDCRDAMGANLVNTLVERLAPLVEEITGETVGLRILSNLSDRRMARAAVHVPAAALGETPEQGGAVAAGIASAWRFAWADPYRAATHNKGVMNGIDAVALATGNDWRALEAGAHAWCARDGRYRPMTRWVVQQGTLHGTLELPLAFGAVGGPTRLHPTARANMAMLGVHSAQELAAVAAAVGLAQNFGALRALATEGIQAGHMRMHARCIAATIGASPEERAHVAQQMVDAREFNETFAHAALERLRHG